MARAEERHGGPCSRNRPHDPPPFPGGRLRAVRPGRSRGNAVKVCDFDDVPAGTSASLRQCPPAGPLEDSVAEAFPRERGQGVRLDDVPAGTSPSLLTGVSKRPIQGPLLASRSSRASRSLPLLIHRWVGSCGVSRDRTRDFHWCEKPLVGVTVVPSWRSKSRRCCHALAAPARSSTSPHSVEQGHAMTTVEQQAGIRPFHVEVSDEALEDLRRRIAATRWPTRELVEDRSQGVQLATMKALARYWTHRLRPGPGRGEAERAAAVHDRDRRSGHPLHPRRARRIQMLCR